MTLTLTFYVATLTLGLRPKQGFAKVRAKSEARESHVISWEVESMGRVEELNHHTLK